MFVLEHEETILSIGQQLQQMAMEEIIRFADQQDFLTARQTECIQWAGRGKTIRDIASILEISESTARDHLNDVRLKLNANNIAHAVSKALTYGFIQGSVE